MEEESKDPILTQLTIGSQSYHLEANWDFSIK